MRKVLEHLRLNLFLFFVYLFALRQKFWNLIVENRLLLRFLRFGLWFTRGFFWFGLVIFVGWFFWLFCWQFRRDARFWSLLDLFWASVQIQWLELACKRFNLRGFFDFSILKITSKFTLYKERNLQVIDHKLILLVSKSRQLLIEEDVGPSRTPAPDQWVRSRWFLMM